MLFPDRTPCLFLDQYLGCDRALAAGFVDLQDVQLLVADRLETQAHQELLADPADPHDTDKGLDRPGQFGGFNAADADGTARLGTKHRDIEHHPDAADRNISQRKFIIFPAQGQKDSAFQEGSAGSATLSHNRFDSDKNETLFSHVGGKNTSPAKPPLQG